MLNYQLSFDLVHCNVCWYTHAYSSLENHWGMLQVSLSVVMAKLEDCLPSSTMLHNNMGNNFPECFPQVYGICLRAALKSKHKHLPFFTKTAAKGFPLCSLVPRRLVLPTADSNRAITMLPGVSVWVNMSVCTIRKISHKSLNEIWNAPKKSIGCTFLIY